MKRLQSWVYGTVGIVLLNASTGCANISYISNTGESLNYSRLGTQKISGLSITRDKDGLVEFKFDTQEGTTGKILEDMATAIKNITTLKVP